MSIASRAAWLRPCALRWWRYSSVEIANVSSVRPNHHAASASAVRSSGANTPCAWACLNAACARTQSCRRYASRASSTAAVITRT